MALWQAAVAVGGISERTYPGSVYTEVTVSDWDGNVKSRSQTWSEVQEQADGAIDTTVVRSLENGRDATEKMRVQSRKSPERDAFRYTFLPIIPENASRVTVTPTSETRLIDGTECTRFDYSMPGQKNETTKGAVWIDSSNAAVRLVEFTIDPLPTGAEELETTVHFQATRDGQWRITSMSTTGKGQILFIKRTFELSMRFGDYFQTSHGRP